MNSINDIQNKIIEEFSILNGDMEMTFIYLMELGEKLPMFPEVSRTDENIVKGCQSKVWLLAEERDGKIMLQADSNTAITKGLVSLLVRILTGQTPDKILDANLYFKEKIGMNRLIGTQRSNGFASMIKQIKNYAIVFKVKAKME